MLGYFWDLASLDETTRANAACSLVQDLAAKQTEYEREGGVELGGGQRSGKKDQDQGTAAALQRCCPLVVYAVKRLCRGLSSSRQGARQGFSLALACLLESLRCVAPGDMLTVLAAVLEPSSSVKGSEARDSLLGLLFGYGAVVRGSPELTKDTALRLATAILQLAAKKSFLKEAAGVLFPSLGRALLCVVLLHGQNSCERRLQVQPRFLWSLSAASMPPRWRLWLRARSCLLG